MEFIDGGTGRNDAVVDLPLAGKPDAGNETSTEVDQPAIKTGHSHIRIEHGSTLAKKRRNGVLSSLEAQDCLSVTALDYLMG